MKLLADLRSEHALIERVVGALQEFAALRASGSADPPDGEAFLRFFRLYAGRFHHAREEAVLFRALVEETEAPADRGPVATLTAQHHIMAAILDAAEAGRLRDLCRRHGAALLHHIDAESSVLFPESETRFRRAGIAVLADREPDADEAAARAATSRALWRAPPGALLARWGVLV